jgi:hypothetical protein
MCMFCGRGGVQSRFGDWCRPESFWKRGSEEIRRMITAMMRSE